MSSVRTLRRIDQRHAQREQERRWLEMSRLQKTVAFVKQQKFWLLTWLMVPVCVPNWLLYNGYLSWFNWAFKTGRVQRVSLIGQRGHIPSIVCGASLWFSLYILTSYVYRLFFR